MKNVPVLFAAAAAGSLAIVAARPAHALGPVDVEVGAKVGFASNPAKSSSSDGVTVTSPNPMGFGVGGRAGVSFMGIYGGVQLMYYFGSSEDVSVLGESASVSDHALLYGLEGGYSFSLGPLTIRPQVGLGNATFSSSSSASGVVSGDVASGSNSNLYVEPGVTGLVSLAGWFVGADVNVLLLPGLDGAQPAVTLHGQVGLKF